MLLAQTLQIVLLLILLLMIRLSLVYAAVLKNLKVLQTAFFTCRMLLHSFVLRLLIPDLMKLGLIFVPLRAVKALL